MNDFTALTWQVDDNVGIVTLNRPDSLNALNETLLREARAVVTEAAHRKDVRALIVTGAGRGFCAGADVKDWGEGAKNPETSGPPPGEEGWMSLAHTLMANLYRLPKPVIAAVNGVAVGAGCDLTLVADMRFASSTARFGEVYARIGFSPDAGGSWLLPRLVGEARASELIYTGRIIDAGEALRIGLVSEVVDPDLLLERAMEQARTFASGPTVAIGLAKQNIRGGYQLTFEDALLAERRAGEICGATEDHKEGLAATIERRPPSFEGR
jgi:enoyl-CoA hydratase/carnithine racemase